MNYKLSALVLPVLLIIVQVQNTANAACETPSAVALPQMYTINWIPWIGDLKSWRNYDPKSISGVGRLITSHNGAVVGEPLAGTPTCNVLTTGEYTFVMKWQNNEVTPDYIENTDIVYLKQAQVLGPDYIRHSQLGAGLPVFCAGTFKVRHNWIFDDDLEAINELTEVTNNSGHYKPLCKCLGVLHAKLTALKVNTGNAKTMFQGSVKDCK